MSDIYPKIPKGKVLPQTKESPSFKKKNNDDVAKIGMLEAKTRFCFDAKTLRVTSFSVTLTCTERGLGMRLVSSFNFQFETLSSFTR